MNQFPGWQVGKIEKGKMSMCDIPPKVQLLPMHKDEPEFRGATHSEVQQGYFLEDLPYKKIGKYEYGTSGLNAAAGTIVLFQYDKMIVASAELIRREKYDQPKLCEGMTYKGCLYFNSHTIRVFDPISAAELQIIWPTQSNGNKFRSFCQVKFIFDPQKYPEFKQIRRNVRCPQEMRCQDLEVPESFRKNVVVNRIVRDTVLARKVKEIHEHRCQIRSCDYRLELPRGNYYAEAHHIKPLSEGGPDAMDNLLCLCPNHHAECDFKAIQLDLKELHQKKEHKISQIFIDFHNKVLREG